MIWKSGEVSSDFVALGRSREKYSNGMSYSRVILKDSVYVPDLTFTLISISRLDLVKCGTLFKDGECTILYPDGRTMATLLLFNGLHCLIDERPATTLDHAQLTTTKMDINKAHQKFGHIAHAAIKHMVKTGMIMGVKLNPDSKPKFYEPSAKAKSNHQLFLKESTVLPGMVNTSTGISGALLQSKLSETITSYKKDEAYIKMQTRHRIK